MKNLLPELESDLRQMAARKRGGSSRGRGNVMAYKGRGWHPMCRRQGTSRRYEPPTRPLPAGAVSSRFRLSSSGACNPGVEAGEGQPVRLGAR